jgi:pimeloyl-ACP methyl ester carboxylesterase
VRGRTRETLSRRLRLVLATEAAVYVALGGWLWAVRGWAPVAAFAAAVLIALGWRTACILVVYALAWRHRSEVPPELRRSFLALLPHAVREVWWWIAVYAGPQAFVQSFAGDDDPPQTSGGRLPVLLVHGYVCNRGAWWWFGRRLAARGEAVWAVTLEPVYAPIDVLARVLAARIDELRAATGARQVVLVTHSMGGLTARAYLRDHGAAKVARLVTIGAPHHGSVHAHLGAGRNARQMEPGSAWLEALARAEEGKRFPPFVSIYSVHDNFVAPQASSAHPAARNVPLAGVGHVSMGFSAEVVERVAAEVDAANAADAVARAGPLVERGL